MQNGQIDHLVDGLCGHELLEKDVALDVRELRFPQGVLPAPLRGWWACRG